VKYLQLNSAMRIESMIFFQCPSSKYISTTEIARLFQILQRVYIVAKTFLKEAKKEKFSKAMSKNRKVLQVNSLKEKINLNMTFYVNSEPILVKRIYLKENNKSKIRIKNNFSEIFKLVYQAIILIIHKNLQVK